MLQVRPMIYAGTKIIKENINGRAILVIAVVEGWASIYSVYNRQNVPASDIS